MFWKRWDLSKFVSAAPINNIVMRMDDARLFRFTEAVMSRLFCWGRLSKIFILRARNSCANCDTIGSTRWLTFAKTPSRKRCNGGKHLRPYWKRRQQRRERTASAKLIRTEWAEQIKREEN